jgi:hypothetical protein
MDYPDNCIDIQYDFDHFRDTRIAWQGDDRTRLDPLLFSSNMAEIEISELYLRDRDWHIWYHVVKSV